MKFSKLCLTSLLALATVFGSSAAFAQYKLRVMVDPDLINPTVTYVDFGSTAIGAVPKATTTFTNRAKSALSVKGSTFTASGTAAMVSHTCGSSVAPGASCTLTTSLNVNAAGAVTGAITINTGASAGPDKVEMEAIGVVAAPLLVGVPSAINMGTVPVKSPATQDLTITNNGNVTSKILGLSVLLNTSSFSLNTANCQNKYLAPGESCAVPITFVPATASMLTASVQVSIENPAGPTKAPLKSTVAALSGTGVTATPEFVVPTLSPFGTLPQSGEPVTYVMGLQNSGKAAFNIKRLTVQGANPTMSVSDYGTCAEGSELAPGLSCEFTVTASVTDFIARTENLYLEYFLSGSNQSTSVKTKTISVRAGFAQVVAEPYALEFTDAPLNQNSVQSITVVNYGTIAASIQGISGTSGVSLSSDCAATLAPKASCIVNVTVAPSALGPISESVSIATSSNLGLNNEVLTGPGVQVIPVTGTVKDTRTFDVSASVLNFGGVPVGSSTTRSLSVLNISNAPLTITNVGVQGTNGYSASHNCTEVPAGDSCTVTVTFAPAAAGSALSTLTVTDGLSTNRTVSLTGVGLAAAITVSSQALDFGNVAVGSTAVQSLTVTNVGTYEAPLSWAAPSNFTQTGGSCAATLHPAASCTLEVTFSPTAEQAYSGQLTISGGAQTSQNVQLTGKGFVPVVVYNPSFSLSDENLNFQTVPVGSPAAKSVTVTNTGDIALRNFAAATQGAAYAGVASCPDPLEIGAGCPVVVSFLPTAEAAFPGSLNISFDGLSSKIVTLSGFGGAPHVQYETATGIALSTVTFGTTAVGSTTIPQVVVLRNAGTAPLNLSGAPFTAVDGFAINATSCANVVLAPNMTCSITVAFAPTVLKNYVGSTSPQSNQATPPALELRGSTGAPSLAFETTGGVATQSVSFGVTLKDTVAVERFVVVRNTGTTPLVLPANPLTLTGPFSATANTCVSATVQPGQTCSFGITFAPTAVQGYSGTLVLSSNAPAHGPFTLTGTGGAPQLVFQTSSGAPLSGLTFSTIAGTTSAAQTAYVKNTGNVAATFNATAATASAPFNALSSTCTNASLAPNQSCAISVVLSAASVQGYTGVLALQSSDANAPTLPLTGTGAEAPTKLLAAGLTCPSTAYIGTAVTCSVSVTSTGNSAASVSSLGVSGLQGGARPTLTPAAAVCNAGSSLSSIQPGHTCTSSVTVTLANVSDYVVTAAPVSSTSTVAPVSKTITVTQPSLSLATQNHPSTLAGVSSAASHTLTNTGIGPVTVAGVLSSTPGISASSAACGTLQPGASCVITSTCNSAAPAVLNTTLSVNTSPLASATGVVSCTVSSASASVAYEPGQTTTVGGFTASGNWVRISNPSVGAVTLKTFVPAVGWRLTSVANAPDACKLNTPIAPGQSCLLLETITGTQGPETTVTGRQLVTSSAGDLSWTSTSLTTKGILISPLAPFANVQVGDSVTATYTLTNQAPAPASSLSFTPTGAGLSVVSNTCGTSIPANGSCTLTLRFAAGAVPTTFNGSISVTATYVSIISGAVQAAGGTAGVQGTLPITFPYVSGNVSLVTGTNTPIYVGATTNLTHTVTNNGVGPVRFVGNVGTITGNNQHLMTPDGTCSVATLLQPGQSCTVVTKFSPTTVAQTSPTLTVPVSTGSISKPVVGRVIPVTDVSVALSAVSTLATGGAGNYTLTVANGIGGPARVLMTLSGVNSGSGSAYLSGFTGGVCGNATLNAAGTVIASTAKAAGDITCTPMLGTKQFELVMPANSSYSGTLTFAAGPSLGQLTVTAAAAISEVFDTNAANNQASTVSLLSLPAADLSIVTTANPASMTLGGTTTLTSTIRNNSSGAAAAVGASAQLSIAQTSLSGGTVFTSIGPIVCGAVTPGATCSASGEMYIPAGGTIYVTNTATGNYNLGRVQFTGTLTSTSPLVGDTNALNNTSNTVVTIAAIEVVKRCKFTGYQAGQNLGVTGTNGQNGWPERTPFSSIAGMGAGDWLKFALFDTWESRTANGYTGMYLDPSKAKFKGSPVSPTLFSFNGSQFIGLKIQPIAEVMVNGHWVEDSINYENMGSNKPQRLIGGVLQATGGGVLPVNALQVWRPSQGINYVSEGAGSSAYAYTSGKQFRQVWIETSPGANCNAAGTTFADYP